MSEFFTAQNLVLDITLCGNWYATSIKLNHSNPVIIFCHLSNTYAHEPRIVDGVCFAGLGLVLCTMRHAVHPVPLGFV